MDRSVGKFVPRALRDAGARVIIHDDVFVQTTKDDQWLTADGIAASITKDRELRYRPREREAAFKAGRPVFILASGNLKKEVMAEIFVKALPRMIQFVRKRKGPWVVRVNMEGEFSSKVLLEPTSASDASSRSRER